MNVAGFPEPGTKIEVCSFGDPQRSDPTEEIYLRIGGNNLFFTIRHFTDETELTRLGTMCILFIIIDFFEGIGLPSVHPSQGWSLLHPEDKYDRRIGARLSAKRAIYKIPDYVISTLDVEHRDIYRAVRMRLPLDDKSISVGGFIDEKKPYIVGEL